MKLFIVMIFSILSMQAWAQEITDFNAPLWNYGTGNGADATGSGVINGVPFTMTFSLNNGTKLFTEPAGTKSNQHTSNSTIGHGGPAGSLLLSGVDEGLDIVFASPVTVTIGFSHINNTSDGWDFITPPDEVVSLNADHEVIGMNSGLRQNSALGNVVTDPNIISYFKWINVTTIGLKTVGNASTTIGFSSMDVVKPQSVPNFSIIGLLVLISFLGFFVESKGTATTKLN